MSFAALTGTALNKIGVTPERRGDIAFLFCMDVTCYFAARYGGAFAASFAIGVVFLACIWLHTSHRPWIGRKLDPIVGPEPRDDGDELPPDLKWR